MFKSKGRTNCPNCGAPIEGEQCEHCGTMFYDFGAVEIGKPAYFKFTIGSMVYTFMGIAGATITVLPPEKLYSDIDDAKEYVYRTPPGITVDLSIQSLSSVDRAPVMIAREVSD